MAKAVTPSFRVRPKTALLLVVALIFASLVAAQPALATGTSINIVSSGGSPQGTTWTLSSGQITTSANAVISASDIQAQLASGNLTLIADNISVDSNINWSSDGILNLVASTGTVTLNNSITATGANAGLKITSPTQFTLNLANSAKVILTGTTPSFELNSQVYTVVNTVSALTAVTAGSGRYALTNSLNLTATYSTALINGTFSGIFEGLGNEISGLKIVSPGSTSTGQRFNLGLFGELRGATVRNLGVTNASITSTGKLATQTGNEIRVGVLAGNVGDSTLVTASVHSRTAYTTTISGVWTGGSVLSSNTIATDSQSAGDRQKIYYAGGLVGAVNNGTINISKSFSNANISSSGSYTDNLSIGGLVGDISTNTDINVSLNVSTANIGVNISQAYATGSLIQGGTGGYVGTGGVVGVIFTSTSPIVSVFTDVYSKNNIVGSTAYGGIVGYATGGSFTNVYTTMSSFGITTAGVVKTATYSAVTSTSPTSGTTLPSGFSSSIWVKDPNGTPVFLGLPTRTPIYVKVDSGTGTYPQMGYSLVDANGTAVDLAALGLTSPSGTPTYTINASTPAGTYQVSYLTGMNLGGANANSYILAPFKTPGSWTIPSVLLTQTVSWPPTNVNVQTTQSPLTPNQVASTTGTGAISYSVVSNSAANCVVDSVTGVLTFETSGNCVVRATAAANSTYSSAYKDVAWTISKAPQTVTWAPANTSVLTTDSPVTPSTSATSSGTGAITYSVLSAGATGCTVNTSTGVVTYSASGTCTIRATAAENAIFTSAIKDVTFTVSKAPQTVTWAPTNTDLSVGASPATPSSVATTSGDGAITYSVISAGTSGCTVDPTTGVLTYNSSGTCTVRASASSTTLYLAATRDVTFTTYDSPVANNNSASTGLNAAVRVDVLTNDSGTGLNVTSVGTSTHGSVTNNGDGTVTFTPTTGYTGSATFSYTVTDVTGVTATATVTISVLNRPVANNDVGHTGVSGGVGSPVTIDVLGNDTGTSITVTSHTTPGHGSVTFNSAGDATYTPSGSYAGIDSFTYTITDSAGQTATATVSIAVDTPPVAVDDLAYTPKNNAITYSVLTNDLGVGDTVVSLGAVTHGVAVLNGDGTITFTPATGFVGSATVSYTINDSFTQTSTGTFTIKVLDAPDAVDDSKATPKNTATNVNVLANDTATGKSVSANTSPSHGSVSFTGGVATYTPTSGFTGIDSFQYTMTDSAGQSATATVTITVVGPPTPVNDSTETHVITSVTKDVLANDAGSSLNVTNITTSSHFTTEINVDNTITFTPNAGYIGTETFTYTVTDFVGQTATATITVKVIPFPTAPDIAFTVGGTQTHLFNPVTSPATGTGLTLSVSVPNHGTATIAAGTTDVTFTPTATSTSAAFTYTVTDELGFAVTGNVNVTIIPAPLAADDAFSTAYSTSISFNVLDNDTADIKDVTSHTNPSHGAVTFNVNDVATYTPVVGFAGTDTFDYTITDSQGQTSTATVTLTVQSTNAPIANDTTITLGASQNSVVDLIALTQGTHPVLTSISQPNSGVAVIDIAHGTATYTATAVTARTQTSFSYTITDELGRTATGTINLVILPAVVAANDSVTTSFNTNVTVTPVSNDVGYQLSVINVSTSLHGTVSQSGNTLTFTPSTGYTGDATFTYSVIDAAGQTATATVTVHINSYALPTADNFYEVTAVGTPIILIPTNHAVGTQLTVSTVSVPGHGTAVMNVDGTVTFTPNAGWFGTDSFTYTVIDPANQTATATIQISVVAPPIAVDDRITLGINSSGSSAVLGNDSGTSLSVTSYSAASGWVVNISTSTISVTPPTGFTGLGEVTYTVTDAVGQTATAKLLITVNSNSSSNGGSNTNRFNLAFTGLGSTFYFEISLAIAIFTLAAFALWISRRRKTEE